MPFITAERYHDISCGHRVVGHESKCRHLHGHNYRIHFTCRAEAGSTATDNVGRVIDFGEIKSKLCMWLEEHWDHKFLCWEGDTLMAGLMEASLVYDGMSPINDNMFNESIVWLPFNPTAENLAKYLVEVVAPEQLKGTSVQLISCMIEETRKCSASFTI